MLGKTLVIGSNLYIWLSGLWGYQAIGFERFVITLGILGYFFTFPPIYGIMKYDM